ncbi:hypothetical protein P152DRAFT_255950 [Eremomyces bilateralis CBS 781.70]|uniref:Uncharacterized protein n=1 Tax=Eremomyces bilateralis CBS 781.70 TaxID=1392243 RepID=A0A6G1FQS9_9PEZI|nr:uncharacterized protein P152DRAFT_255950 [Eremomyces bilateralis CBS 781.70]KAF1808123.1 hypothetical protein P152DRAFT_255950 [Eremomyces bilateralis CBS 781.70]
MSVEAYGTLLTSTGEESDHNCSSVSRCTAISCFLQRHGCSPREICGAAGGPEHETAYKGHCWGGSLQCCRGCGGMQIQKGGCCGTVGLARLSAWKRRRERWESGHLVRGAVYGVFTCRWPIV